MAVNSLLPSVADRLIRAAYAMFKTWTRYPEAARNEWGERNLGRPAFDRLHLPLCCTARAAIRFGGQTVCRRLIVTAEKGTWWPIRECEWDKGGGFTKSGPGDSQMHFPRSFFLSVSYGPMPPGPRGRSGRSEVDGSDPPFLLPGAGAGALRNSHLRNTPWGGRSRPNYPSREGKRMAP